MQESGTLENLTICEQIADTMVKSRAGQVSRTILIRWCNPGTIFKSHSGMLQCQLFESQDRKHSMVEHVILEALKKTFFPTFIKAACVAI